MSTRRSSVSTCLVYADWEAGGGRSRRLGRRAHAPHAQSQEALEDPSQDASAHQALQGLYGLQSSSTTSASAASPDQLESQIQRGDLQGALHTISELDNQSLQSKGTNRAPKPQSSNSRPTGPPASLPTGILKREKSPACQQAGLSRAPRRL